MRVISRDNTIPYPTSEYTKIYCERTMAIKINTTKKAELLEEDIVDLLETLI